MGAYDIDAATAGRIIGDTETILQQNENIYGEVQGLVDEVETALGSSRVLSAFSTFATESLMHDIQAVVTRSENAVFATRRAVNEYAAGDYEMFANSQRAAASQGILSLPAESSFAWTPEPVSTPVLPPESVPAGQAPAPLPAPAPPTTPPVPSPEIIGSEPGVATPLPAIVDAWPPQAGTPIPETGTPEPETGAPPNDPPVYQTLPAYLPEADLSRFPVATPLPAIVDPWPPQAGTPIPETGTPEPETGAPPNDLPVLENPLLIISLPEDSISLPEGPTPQVGEESPLIDGFSRADLAPSDDVASSPARRGRWGLT